jgi:hypothetical protein
MNDLTRFDRRTVLRTLGAGSLAAVAGCSGNGSSGDDSADNESESKESDEGSTDDQSSGSSASYSWAAATQDTYWYSLYNMSTNIAMSGNGVPVPAPGKQKMKELKEKRLPQIIENSDTDKPPIANPNLTFAPFTEGDPHFTQKPVFEDDSGRPNAKTLAWDKAKSSKIVSPSSLAWTHLKGVTWAKNFQTHVDIVGNLKPKFRAQLLSTLAQVGVKASILDGGSRGNGALTNGDSFEFLSQYAPLAGEIKDETSRPHHHAAMLWFLSDLTSLAQNGWFGYVNPKPLLPKEKGAEAVMSPPLGIQEIADKVAKTTMDTFSAEDVVNQESTRSAGLMLAATGYYGPQAGGSTQQTMAADYANALAGVIEQNLAGNGMVENGAKNQAATQGIVGQGLLWATRLDGVDYADTAKDVLGYMLDELWDEDAGTFKPSETASAYFTTARDAGDITGGLNAADAVLEMDGIKETFARYFNQTFNRGQLQRAQRPSSVDRNAEFQPPKPPKAGGEYGQAAVYNAEVEYDPDADEWSVTDDRFKTGEALYLANQDIWISQWPGGDFYDGRGIPGESDDPPEI